MGCPIAGPRNGSPHDEGTDPAPVHGGVAHCVVVRLPVIPARRDRPIAGEVERSDVAVLVALPVRGPDEVAALDAADFEVPVLVELAGVRDRRSYIELLAIADRDEAMRSPLGSAVAAAIERGDGLITWAVAVDDVERVASDLGTDVTTVRRQGMVARLTGVAESMAEPCLPFFIERDPVRALRSDAGAAPGIGWIEVSGSAERLEQWLGGASLPIRLVA